MGERNSIGPDGDDAEAEPRLLCALGRVCSRVSRGRSLEEPLLNSYGNMGENAGLEGTEGSQPHTLGYHY